MLLDSPSKGNLLRWDGKTKPFYEVYYLKLVDPHCNWSFWARYTLLIPRAEKEESSASVWAIFHHKNEKPIALKKTYLLSKIDILHSDHFLQIDKSHLSLGQAYGYMEEGSTRIEWDFIFEDPNVSACLYPHEWIYSFPFPKTKFVEPRLSTTISGNLNINNRTESLHRYPAHQAHLWGTQYATRWAWGNCNTFKEDSSAVFEGLAAQIPIGPFQSPTLALFYFIWNEKIYKANGLCQWVKNKSHHQLLKWHFEAIAKDTKFVGTITRDVTQIAGVAYLGPNGEKRFCHNTNRANMELTIFEKKNKKWNFAQKLTANNSTSFETVEPTPDSRIEFVL